MNEEFIRSITDTAGTISLSTGRNYRGWVTEGEADFVYFLVALPDEDPGSDRVERAKKGEFGVHGDDAEPTVLLINVAHVVTYEWAGDDGW